LGSAIESATLDQILDAIGRNGQRCIHFITRQQCQGSGGGFRQTINDIRQGVRDVVGAVTALGQNEVDAENGSEPSTPAE
jgi:hypothetical protein